MKEASYAADLVINGEDTDNVLMHEVHDRVILDNNSLPPESGLLDAGSIRPSDYQPAQINYLTEM